MLLLSPSSCRTAEKKGGKEKGVRERETLESEQCGSVLGCTSPTLTNQEMALGMAKKWPQHVLSC